MSSFGFSTIATQLPKTADAAPMQRSSDVCIYILGDFRTSVNIITQYEMLCNTKTNCLHFFYNLDSSKSKILPLRSLTHTAGKIRWGEPYQNRVLSEAFDFMPRNDDIVLSPQPEKTIASRNQKCQYPCVLTVEFKIRGIAEPRAVT